jgi:predicted metal-binding protein
MGWGAWRCIRAANIAEREALRMAVVKDRVYFTQCLLARLPANPHETLQSGGPKVRRDRTPGDLISYQKAVVVIGGTVSC